MFVSRFDEEDSVWGSSEEFNECGSVREWFFDWSWSGRRNEEIGGDFGGVFEHEDVFSRYMLFMLRGWFLCEFGFCFMIEVVMVQ